MITLAIGLGAVAAHAEKNVNWSPALNGYFGAALDEPTYAEMRDALAAHLNRQTLDNVDPENEYRRFKDFVRRGRKDLSRGKLKAGDANELYQNMTEYLALEAKFDEMRLKKALAEASDLVGDHARSAPDWPPDFTKTLLYVMRKRKMLVPSTVLFNVYLNPYRPVVLPKGTRLMPMARAPEVRSDGHRVEILVTFPEGSGPLARIDFETVDLAGIVVEVSADGIGYRGLAHIGSELARGVTTPIIFQAPIRAPYLRLIGLSPTNPAMLRELQLYTLEGLE